ncbi:unnamed protein product [Allacma fusca]|uniref:Uncharacterized protein n=1 Tax=Allacma fusca TaxID=39272 RepID=A0A8J2PBY9_9HEXA|nr:unnamed protein product [Allacma fusca]
MAQFEPEFQLNGNVSGDSSSENSSEIDFFRRDFYPWIISAPSLVFMSSCICANVIIFIFVFVSRTYKSPANYLLANLCLGSTLYIANFIIYNFEKAYHLWSYGPWTCIVDSYSHHKLSQARRGWKFFNSKRTGLGTYVCWAKTSNSPSVGFVTCANPVECGIRSQCFKKKTRCDSIDAKSCPGGCVLLTIQNQPGILKCDGDGLDQIKNNRVNQFIGISNTACT